MKKNVNDGARLVEMLVCRYKMTHSEIAKYLGVMRYVVTLWGQGEVYPKEENYAKLKGMVERLSGKAVRYAHEAMDILMGR